MNIIRKSTADSFFRTAEISCDTCGTVFSFDSQDELYMASNRYEITPGQGVFFEIHVNELIAYLEEYVNDKPITSEFILPPTFPKDKNLIKDLKNIAKKFKENEIVLVCPYEHTSIITNTSICPICNSDVKISVLYVPYLICLIDGEFEYDPIINNVCFKTYCDDTYKYLFSIVFKSRSDITWEEMGFFNKMGYSVTNDLDSTRGVFMKLVTH